MLEARDAAGRIGVVMYSPDGSVITLTPEHGDLVKEASMDVLEKALLFVHLVGMAALLGGALVQVTASSRRVSRAMVDGALTQVVSGLLLVGVIEGQDEEVDHAKIAVKFAVGVVVAVLVWLNRRKPEIPTGLYAGIVALTLGNVAVAVFW